MLLLARDTAVSARTAAINTLKALILTAPECTPTSYWHCAGCATA